MRHDCAVTLALAVSLAWAAVACIAQEAPKAPTATTRAIAATLAPSPSPTPRTARGVVTVDAAEQYFNPAHVTVSAGTTVVWSDVQGTHDMVADDRSFASAVLFEGGSYAHTFATPGHYHYVCTLHLGAGMWADVDVVP
jgi:plastocyanin